MSTLKEFTPPDFDFNAVPDIELMPLNEEQTLKIVGAEYYENEKKGTISLKITSKHAYEPERFGYIIAYLGIPGNEDDKETQINKLRRLKRFHEAIGYTGSNLPAINNPQQNEYVQRQFRAIVGVDDNDPQYEPKNSIVKYLVD
jgi:hypothetical protein